MAKKIDLSGVKEFMFNHGEKVALGSCALVAVLCGSLGLMRAMGAGADETTSKPWVTAFRDVHQKIVSQLGSVPEPQPDPDTAKKMDVGHYHWNEITSSYVQTRYLETTEDPNDKRQNPVALAIRTEPKTIYLETIRGLVFTHKYNTDRRTVMGLREAGQEAPPVVQPKGANVPVNVPPLLQSAQARRLVVGTAIFPMKKQVDEFVKALRMSGQKELFDSPDDLPKPLGFNLMRFEHLPNGQVANKKGELLIGVDPDTGKFRIAPGIEKLLRESFYDEKFPEALEPWIWAGLTMPMPKLANARFGKFDLDGGIEFAPEDPDAERMPKEGPGVMPKKGPPGNFKLPIGRPKPPTPMNPEGQQPVAVVDRKEEHIKEQHLASAHPNLPARLFGDRENKERFILKDFNPYHILGFKPLNDENPNPLKPEMGGAKTDGTRYFSAWHIKPEMAGPEGVIKQPAFPKKGGAEQANQPPPFPNWDRDAIVRFIDADVEPGKTYSYAIQIRLANPNFGKKKLVAYEALAAVEELYSRWEHTQPISIPGEYFLYAVDQNLLEDIAAERKLSAPEVKDRDKTAFQVHQWISRSSDLKDREEYVIGDFAIAERVLVRRGDPIGYQVPVQVPVWRELKEMFELPFKSKKEKGVTKSSSGMLLDLVPGVQDGAPRGEIIPPVLVDFTSGKRRPPNSSVEEDTAVDALVLGPDGKLRVLNSRRDSDTANPNEQERLVAQERQERLLNARRRVEEVQQGNQQKGPNMPGAPRVPGGGNGG